MRLLFASPFPHLPDSTNGREASTHALALRLRQRGLAVAVFAGLPEAARNEHGRPLLTQDETLGYPVYRVREPLLAYGDALADWRPDVAILPFAAAAMPLVTLGLAARVKTVLHATSLDPGTSELNLVEDPGLLLTACSPFAARRLDTLQGVVPPVNLPLIEPELYRVEPKGKSVLMVNPTALKGVELFFRLAEKRPDVSFIMVESWDVGDQWRLILGHRARALGNVALWPASADMRPAYASARLVLMPSIHEETYGRVIAEAQVSGIPALASDRGALKETVGQGGLTVPLDAGIDAWCAAFDRIWDPGGWPTFAAAAYHESVRPERQPDSIVDGLIAILEEFLR